MRNLLRHADTILSFQGGVGNQLFEWAFAQSLSAAGRRVAYDTVRCRGSRPFELGPLIPRDRLLSGPVGVALAGLERIHALEALGLRGVIEPPGAAVSSVREQVRGGRTYVRGYFQSPSYFRDCEETVRTQVHLLLTSMLTRQGRLLLEELQSDTRTVAVHVRRGDYMTTTNSKVHGVLSMSYYTEALDRVADAGLHRRVWFSDDLDWVRRELARPGDLLCPSEATTRPGGEIALMAACRSRIIANSSFSWWGAWLGEEATQSSPVVAPAVWFASSPDDPATDLIPDNWLRL